MQRCFPGRLRRLISMTLAWGWLSVWPITTWPVEHRVEILNEPAPSELVSGEQLAELGENGMRVVRGASTELCDIWFRREWPGQDGFTPSLAVQFPFNPGEFVGVIRFHRRGGDYRDQRIPSGVYVLRAGLQPVDGNHVGTSDTRDFLLLLKADSDRSLSQMSVEEMFTQSAAAIDSSHPAILALKTAPDDNGEPLPHMQYNELNDQWMLVHQGTLRADGQHNPLRIALVIAGHAAEQ